MRILGFMLLVLGGIGMVIALPLLGFAALGHFGILADVGPEENRAMGGQLLSWGLPPLIGGTVLCVLGFVAVTRGRRPAAAESHAAGHGPG